VREFDAQDLVETVREGLSRACSDLAIRFANRSFCETFAVAPEDAKLYELATNAVKYAFPGDTKGRSW
jgi:chemotaxis protein methyltransferase CheR